MLPLCTCYISYTWYISYTLSTWYNRYTTIEKEELLYPSSTMVAEVGGTLGLFLGVSFMTIWDGALWIKGDIALSKPIEWRHP